MADHSHPHTHEEITHTHTLVEGFTGLCPAEKGFDPWRQPLLQARYGVRIVTPAKSKKGSTTPARCPQVLFTGA